MSEAYLALFNEKLARVKRADPLSLPSAVKDFAEVAAATIRDLHNDRVTLTKRVEALEAASTLRNAVM